MTGEVWGPCYLLFGQLPVLEIDLYPLAQRWVWNDLLPGWGAWRAMDLLRKEDTMVGSSISKSGRSRPGAAWTKLDIPLRSWKRYLHAR